MEVLAYPILLLVDMTLPVAQVALPDALPLLVHSVRTEE